MSQTNLTADETIDSLTGWDEIAIAHHFGSPWPELAENDTNMFARALVFIVKRRDGATDDEARNAALELTVKDLNSGFFAEKSDEEAGKGEQPEPSPAESLSSVS